MCKSVTIFKYLASKGVFMGSVLGYTNFSLLSKQYRSKFEIPIPPERSLLVKTSA